MDDISDVHIRPCAESKYIRPMRIHYKQNGKQKIWDAMQVHDSVAIVLFNTTRKVFIFVQQFRPAIYLNVAKTHEENGETRVDTAKYPGAVGLTYELCAGIVDKQASAQEIAQDEIYEECGYKVPLDNIHKITSFRSGVGTTGAMQTMFYAEVTDDMQTGKGGGCADEGEMISVVEVPASKVREFLMDESRNRPVGMIFGVMWFLDNKLKA